MEADIDNRRVYTLYSQKQVVGERRVVEGEDFVADKKGGDFSRRKVALDVGFDPISSAVWILNFC